MILSHFQAEPLLKAHRNGTHELVISTDLNLTTRSVTLHDTGVELAEGVQVTWAQLQSIAEDENGCFAVEDGDIRKIRTFSEETNRQCSLMPTSGAPTLLLAGFPMHRIKNTDPAKDTRSKIKALGHVSGRVLDTNTGLGYTAIALSEHAAHVTTIELDPGVLEIARQNPWSAKLFDNPRITQIIGDSYEEIAAFEDGAFDALLHDPPTLELAGDLYSGVFYREVYRVLRRGGRLFHYIGDPRSVHGARVTKGVIRRLGEVGFQRVQSRADAFGVAAIK
ncbi:MAG: methyltransferase domain-containing protein [Anaerolineae bacterium]